MPGKVTLRSSARQAFVRGERGVPDPIMFSKVFSERRVPRSIGWKPPTQARGEFRRSVKPSRAGGSRMRHAEVRARFIYPNKGGGREWGRKVSGYMNYLTRNGAGIDGERAQLFGPDGEGGTVPADRGKFFAEARGDRFVLEIIIPPNDGGSIRDMEGLTAAVMEQVQKDLGTRLTWVAVVHEKDDAMHAKNKHAHVLVRGVDEDGHELRIRGSYLTSTLRDVAQKEISAHPTSEREKGWRLGPMSEIEAAAFKKQLEDNRPRREERGLTKPRGLDRGREEDEQQRSRGRHRDMME